MILLTRPLGQLLLGSAIVIIGSLWYRFFDGRGGNIRNGYNKQVDALASEEYQSNFNICNFCKRATIHTISAKSYLIFHNESIVHRQRCPSNDSPCVNETEITQKWKIITRYYSICSSCENINNLFEWENIETHRFWEESIGGSTTYTGTRIYISILKRVGEYFEGELCPLVFEGVLGSFDYLRKHNVRNSLSENGQYTPGFYSDFQRFSLRKKPSINRQLQKEYKTSNFLSGIGEIGLVSIVGGVLIIAHALCLLTIDGSLF